MIDVAELRSRFPALASSRAVFVDGPAGTQVPRAVIDTVATGLETAASNVGAAWPPSARSGEVVAAARWAAADLLGGAPDEIAFGPNMTTITFAVSRALAAGWGPGDRIVLSGLDHDANVAPWVRAAADRGVEAVFAGIDPADVTLDLDHLESLVDHRTRLVAVTGCSNAFGSRVDLARVAAAAHAVGALCYVDGVHLAPHVRIDVAALDVDMLVCSAYKFYGPHVGVLWGRRQVLAGIDAYKVRPAPTDPAGKFETGTPSFALLAGVEAAVGHIASLGEGGDRPARLDDAYRRVAAHERALGERFIAGLPERVTLWGPPTMDGRVSTFAISIDGLDAATASVRLGERGIYTWAGHYYAVEPMTRLGLLGGLVRIGLVAYTTEDEVDRVLEALAEL
jgi:cysteine desulfurase family protein (TIGR01976 family)